jgi:hypothetical protein
MMSQVHIGLNEIPIADTENKFSLHAEVEDKKDIRGRLLYINHMGMHEASLSWDGIGSRRASQEQWKLPKS